MTGFKDKRICVFFFTSFFVALFILAFLMKPLLTRAAAKAFLQSDWSGGADTVTTADSDNLLEWTKYYSKDSGVDTATQGEVKLTCGNVVP